MYLRGTAHGADTRASALSLRGTITDRPSSSSTLPLRRRMPDSMSCRGCDGGR
jgi:hypothetical protein